MKKRFFSGEEKMAIVLEGIKGIKSIADICREHQISQTLFYRWRDVFLEGGKAGLEHSNNGYSREDVLRAEIERLYKVIGKQTIQIEVLKKTEEYFSGRK